MQNKILELFEELEKIRIELELRTIVEKPLGYLADQNSKNQIEISTLLKEYENTTLKISKLLTEEIK